MDIISESLYQIATYVVGFPGLPLTNTPTAEITYRTIFRCFSRFYLIKTERNKTNIKSIPANFCYHSAKKEEERQANSDDHLQEEKHPIRRWVVAYRFAFDELFVSHVTEEQRRSQNDKINHTHGSPFQPLIFSEYHFYFSNSNRAATAPAGSSITQ